MARFGSDRFSGALGALALAASLAIAGCGGTETGDGLTADASSCPLGERLGSGRSSGGLVLGCGELRDGRELQLRYRGGCIEVVGMDDESSRGCGVPPTVREPEQSRAVQRSGTVSTGPGARIEVYGQTLPDVDGVVLTYMRDGLPGRASTELIAVNDRGLPQELSIVQRGRPIGVDSCKPYEGLAPDAFILGGA